MRSEIRHIAIIKEPKHKTISNFKSTPVRLDRVVLRCDSVVYRLAAYSSACCCNPPPQIKLLKAAASCKEML